MRALAWFILLVIAGTVLPAWALPSERPHSPTAGPAAIPWETASAESAGFDRAKLDALRDALASRNTKAFLIVRHNRIVYEWYGPGWGPEKRHYTASLHKSLGGGMALLLALNDGRLALDDPAARYIPAWRDDPVRSRITIRALATHSSGIEDANEPGVRHADLDGWMGAFWRRDPDPFSIALTEAPVLFPPGSGYVYSNPGYAALGYAITASLRDAPARDIRTLLRERIMAPIGVPDEAWSMSYDTDFELDGLTLNATWGGAAYTARAVARVGQLMLDQGRWNGQPLVDPRWVEAVTAYGGTPLPERSDDPVPAPTAGWYTNFDGVWPSLPRDAFVGAGAGNQALLVVPSLDLVVVRFGEALGNPLMGEGFWGGLQNHLFEPLMLALVETPYPPSPVIQRVSFDPPETIVRQAIGSDNWPITWADDDLLYTAYGDGWGFEPRADEKLSLGFAKIAGGAQAFHGENIRSPSGERLGDGPQGPKASGMLSVDGVLYVWVRNLGNAQLAWSGDHGRSWEWGFRLTESFGSPSFLNFGRDYAGARDDYVYMYSQDGPSAYEADDAVVLTRVARARIRERSAYEFFAGLGADGEPRWSPRIEERAPVFHFAGHCQRVDVVYHPGIGRYLMALGFNHKGGWGLFDAPQPWGPWTSAFFTTDWGLGRTQDYRLPSKWIDAGDNQLYVVFSGKEHNGVNYDAFSVRRMQLHLRSGDAPGLAGADIEGPR